MWTRGFQAPGWEGKVSAWSDWYALGVSIEQLLVRTSRTCAASSVQWYGSYVWAVHLSGRWLCLFFLCRRSARSQLAAMAAPSWPHASVCRISQRSTTGALCVTSMLASTYPPRAPVLAPQT